MNILLIDDHVLFAKSLEIALEDYTEIEKFIYIKDISQVISIIKNEKPDIILIDINLGKIDNDGLSLAKDIIRIIPKVKIVMLTGYDLPVYKYEAQKMGAKGFINKNIEPDKFIEILNQIQNGYNYFPNEIKYIEELTHREKLILQFLYNGVKRKDIATQLYLSERTVSNHIQNIFDKLNVSSSLEAVTKGVQLGYIKLNMQ
ncbi:response regulator transcription factor [Clostridioides sp. ES-S-0005-03]|nr:response regulator transcription factor [Clostridioides sp. ES-S-0001-03]MCC0655033.1 response regulator transcription factor [Clostridioides sp. ES-S-0123-01]MCC0679812.1 response regulator transcription factor [Clostridioides sp. ES-S-0005-03]MCC0702096.1 response regulator transcription factor [Clostridioides sp. ES-S-0049-02]UDN49390.1 response regulator transcription factor [Clostridioides sp. ES-S-0173-01]UDN60151.1 response regulator transcription factor [Clostridioides sp. ES-S-0010